MVQCKYCLEERDKLEVSHIIPKLVYRWIKKTATTGRMRDGRNMNKPAQDGLKQEMLCRTCESGFSEYETYFANQVFHKLIENDGFVNYSDINWDKFNKFTLSLLWRTVYFCANEKSINKDYYPEEIKRFNEKANLLKNAFDHENDIPLNVYFIPLCSSSVDNGFFELEDYVYFERSVSLNLIINDADKKAATLYIKLPYVMIVCEIENCEHHLWKGLKLNDRERFGLSDVIIPQHVKEYMSWDCQRCYDLARDIPSNQVEKLKKIMNDKGSPEQGTIKAMMKNSFRE